MCRYILRAMPRTGGTVKVRISTVQLYNCGQFRASGLSPGRASRASSKSCSHQTVKAMCRPE
nr:MAG TPA: hypothetical protein [Caudoviricetes sp.]